MEMTNIVRKALPFWSIIEIANGDNVLDNNLLQKVELLRLLSLIIRVMIKLLKAHFRYLKIFENFG